MIAAPPNDVLEGLVELGATLDAPLGPLTTYRVGGGAAALLTVDSGATLAAVARVLARSPEPVEVLVVGRGSNLLVADAGFAGVAIRLAGEFESLRIDRVAATVEAGGAVPLPVVGRRSAAEGLRGLEWAVGVPGSVGGAVRMNAGGHGSDVAATVRSVHVFDLRTGQDDSMDGRELGLGYRASHIGPDQVVMTATFALTPGDADEANAAVSEVVAWRRANQPGGPNAGSVFTNPPGDSAGRLVEQAGCKGLRIGTAEVSTKHANFIRADAGGRAADVAALMKEVAHRVAADSGVDLRPETVLVGFDPEEGP